MIICAIDGKAGHSMSRVNKIRAVSVVILLFCCVALEYELHVSEKQTQQIEQLNDEMVTAIKKQEYALESQRKTIQLQENVIEEQRTMIRSRDELPMGVHR
jgi:cell division protein FtsB